MSEWFWKWLYILTGSELARRKMWEHITKH
jgi:hypothetical protein